MDKGALFSAAEIDENIPTIDLHSSKTIQQAMDQLERELFFYYQDGADYCEIVYGGGTGKLKEKTLKEIKNNPMIKDFKEKHAGSCVVLF